MNKKSRIVIGLVLTFICLFVVAFYVYNNNDVVKYKKQMELGHKYLEEMDYEQARVAFENAIRIEPANVEPYIGLTEACRNIAYEEKTEESYEMAKLACERAIEVDSENVTFYIGAAESCINLNYNNTTEGYLQKATDLLIQKENDVDEYIKISRLYLKLHDYKNAMKILKRASEINPAYQELKDAYFEIGLKCVDEYVNMKKYSEALLLLDEIEKMVTNEIIESKRQEINDILEKQKEESLARQKAKKQEEEKREQEEFDAEVLEWLVRDMGLAKEYPILQGYSEDDANKYILAYGYDMDYYEYWYTFLIDKNIWTVSEYEQYDGKSGLWSPLEKNVGQTYDLTITDEIRSEYRKYKERQTIFSNYATLFNSYLKDIESEIYTAYNLKKEYLEEYTEDRLIGVFVYWEKEPTFYTRKTPLIIKVSINTETNEMKFLDVDDKSSYGIDYAELHSPVILNN